MPRRHLPRSIAARTTALSTCFAKYNSVAPDDRLISADQFTALTDGRTPWLAAVGALPALLEAQTLSTAQLGTAAAPLRQLISHFIQVFNLAVARGVFPAAQRAYYGLDVSSDTVPELDAHADLVRWADQLVAGENTRVLAGGPPLAFPSIGDVNGARLAYEALLTPHSAAKDAYDQGQEAISSQVPAIDALILDLWDTIEFNLRANDPSSLRRKAREWGVVYDGDEEEEPPTPPTPPTP